MLGTVSVKKGAYKLWKQGRVTWEVYRDAVRTCRHRIRKAKVQVELNLERDVKSSKEHRWTRPGATRER